MKAHGKTANLGGYEKTRKAKPVGLQNSPGKCHL